MAELHTIKEATPRKKVTTNTGRQLVQLLGGDIVYGRKLPFALYDENGFLLAPQASKLPSREKQTQLIEREVYVDAKEHAAHMAKIASAVDFMFEKNICLVNWRDHEAFSDTDVEVLDDANLKILSNENPFEIWDNIKNLTKALLLKNISTTGNWLQRLDSVVLLIQNMLRKYPDASMYYLVQINSKLDSDYDINQVLLCAASCDRLAQALALEDLPRQRLFIGALCMHLATTRLNNDIAVQKNPPSPAQLKLLEAQGLESAKQLHSMGVTDPTLLCLIKNHQYYPTVSEDLSELDTLQMSLCAVSKMCTKLTPKNGKTGSSPASAVKDAVQDLGKLSMPVALALLNSFGAYPPGSFVKMKCGEIGVVLHGGEKPTTPRVGTVFNKEGYPFTEMYMRDTARPQYAVIESLTPQSVRAFIKTENLLKMYLPRKIL